MAGLSVVDLLLAGLRRRTPQDAARPENVLFDRGFYADKYPFVVKGGIDLHEHYSYFGCRNGYDPNAFFDSAWYLAQNADVAASGANPLDHYLETGAAEGRDPSPAFGGWLYLLLYPDVRTTGVNPLLHYLRHGRAECRMAPPACLLPSVVTMRDTQPSPADIACLAEAKPLLDLVRAWHGDAVAPDAG